MIIKKTKSTDKNDDDQKKKLNEKIGERGRNKKKQNKLKSVQCNYRTKA